MRILLSFKQEIASVIVNWREQRVFTECQPSDSRGL